MTRALFPVTRLPLPVRPTAIAAGISGNSADGTQPHRYIPALSTQGIKTYDDGETRPYRQYRETAFRIDSGIHHPSLSESNPRKSKGINMNQIIFIVGAIVIVLALLSFVGLR